MANQHSNRPPMKSEFLIRYENISSKSWKKSQLQTQRVGLRRFDEWLYMTKIPLSEINWNKLLEFHRFLTMQGHGTNQAKRSVEFAKNVIRFGISNGELPQKIEEVYVYNRSQNKWSNLLPELSENFLSQVEVTHPGGIRAHRYAHRVFHAYLAERKLTYRRLRRGDLIAFMKYTKDKKLAHRTRIAMGRHTRAYLRWLNEERKISRNVDELLSSRIIPKPLKTLPRSLDPELDMQLQKLLEETDDIYYQSILLLRRTGLRITELRKLEFDCIEYDLKGRARLIVPPIKLGFERRVPLDDALVKLIKNIQSKSTENYTPGKNPPAFVIGHTGTPAHYERYSGAIVEICAKINAKSWINLHSLRHTYATNLLNAGLSIVSLKQILGHKTIHMSLGYAKVTGEKIHLEYDEALKKMNDERIPDLLIPKNGNAEEEAFITLSQSITKKIDGGANDKKLKALLNRISRVKMELKQI